MRSIVWPELTELKILDLCNHVLSKPQSGQGLTIAEMRKRLQLFDLIDACVERSNGSEGPPSIRPTVLEEAEYEIFRRCVDQFQWGIAHHEILSFADAVIGAEILPKEKELKHG